MISVECSSCAKLERMKSTGIYDKDSSKRVKEDLEMLESIDRMVLCGAIEWNNSMEPIYCDPNGTLVFETGDGGCWCLSEINIGNPLPMANINGICNNLDEGGYGDAIGAVYAADGKIVVFLDEEYAVLRSIIDTRKNIDEPFFYSTDEEYDLDDELE